MTVAAQLIKIEKLLSAGHVPAAWIISCNVFGVLAAICLISSKVLGLFTTRGSSTPYSRISNNNGDEEDDAEAQNPEEDERQEAENEVRNLGFIQFLGFTVAAYNQWVAFDTHHTRPWSIKTATSPIFDLVVYGVCAVLYFFTSTRKCISLGAFKKLRTWLIIGGLLLIMGTLITLRLVGVISDEEHVILLCFKSATIIFRRSFRIWSLYTTSVEWKPQVFAMDFLEMTYGLFAIMPLVLMSAYVGDARVWRLNYPRAVLAIALIIVNFWFCFRYHIPASNRASSLRRGESDERLQVSISNCSDNLNYGSVSPSDAPAVQTC